LASDTLILGFDTSAAHCAAALLSGDRVVATRHEAMATGQAEALMPLLETLLSDAGLVWADLSAIGVGVGPGNFTGTRIAVAAARGLALALSIPAVGVSRFEALAEGLPRPLYVIEAAHRGEMYLQEFDATGAQAPRLLGPDDLPHAISAPAATGSASAEAAARIPGLRVLAPVQPLAVAIARVAAARWRTPGLPRPAPIYLRPADAAPARDGPPPLLP